jgi:hypothetical protein
LGQMRFKVRILAKRVVWIKFNKIGLIIRHRESVHFEAS